MHFFQTAFLFICLSTASVLIGQETTITGDYKNEAVTEILQDIRSQAKIKLAYDARVLRNKKRSIRFENLPVDEALNSVLIGSGYEAVYIKRTWLIIPTEARAQEERDTHRRDFKVSGRLIDGQTGEALSYANVSLRGKLGGTVSNLDGFFNIPRVAIDTLQLCVTYVGYQTRCITLGADDTENMLIKLSPADTYLMVVEVTDRQVDDISLSPMEDLIRLDARSLARSSSRPQPDLFTSLKSLPGVSSNDGLDAQLHIRGGDEDENLVLWDGFTLYHLDHFFGVFSTLNPAVIKQVSLLKGPYSSRYGGRSGGVLDVVGKSGDRQAWHSQVDINFINAGVLSEGPLTDKSSYLLSYRRSHTDFLSSTIYEQILDRVFNESTVDSEDELVSRNVSTDYFYHDFNLKWSYEASDKDRVALSLFQGGDSFDRTSSYRFEEENSPLINNDFRQDDSDWGNTGIGAVWTRNPEPGKDQYTSLGRSVYTSNYYFSDEERNFFNEIPLPRVFSSSLEQNRVHDITFVHGRHRLMNKGFVDFGYQYTYLETSQQSTEPDLINDITRWVDSTHVANQHTVFADRTWTHGEHLRGRIGSRLGSNSFTDRLYLEPRLRVDYLFSENLGLHLASGNYIQQVRRVSEQNLFLRQADRWQMSDGKHVPESRTFHSSIGLDWTWDVFDISVELFYKQLKGVLLNQAQARLLSTGSSNLENFATGKGETAGIDFLLRLDYKGHSAWLSYSYTASANSISLVNEGRSFPSAFNKPHDLKLTYNYRHRAYQLHADLMASSGYPYTPILGFFEGPGGDPFLVYGDDLSARLPSLFRVDIGLSRRVTVKNTDIEMGLGVFNLTNHRNVRRRSFIISDTTDDISDDLKVRAVDLELLRINPTFMLILNLQ